MGFISPIPRDRLKFRPLSLAEALGAVANRETIVTDFADLQTAINDTNTAGGGIVRIDGMLTMTGDVTMKSNVILMGYGPGTGLKNSSANDYDIDFTSTPTYYDIGALSASNASFTTDTAAEAGNFSAGDYVLIKDDTTTYRVVHASRVVTDGVVGTGVVAISRSVLQAMNAASQAGVLGMGNAGLMLMDIKNTSTGSIDIDIDGAYNITMERVSLDECTVVINDAYNVFITNCTFDVTDNTSHTSHIDIQDWVDSVTVEGNKMSGATRAVGCTGSKAVFNVGILNNELSGSYGVYAQATTTTTSGRHYWHINNNRIIGREGSGTDYGIWIKSGEFWDFSISGNTIEDFSAAIQLDYVANAGYRNGNITANYTNGPVICKSMWFSELGANCIDSNLQLTHGPQEVTVTCNRIGGLLYLTDNNALQVARCMITGNTINSTTYCTSDSSRYFIENTFSGNVMDGVLTVTEDMTDCVFVGNFINGNVTFGASGDTLDRNVFSSNNVDGSVTFSEANTDYNVVTGNTTNGAITDISDGVGGGTGNVLEHNTQY